MANSKTYTDSVLGQVTIRKNRLAKRMSIRVLPVKGVVVTIPSWMPFKTGEVFLATKRDWAGQALARVEERVREDLARKPEQGTMVPEIEGISPAPATVTEETIEKWRKMAKESLPPRLAELAGKYGFSYGRVAIKHNRSNWGSCSAKGNINLNLNLVRLPKELQDYVMLHELCHLRYMDHGTLFHRLLEDLCRQEMPGYGGPEAEKGKSLHEVLRKQLKSYILM